MHNWTTQEINYLTEYYSILGLTECSKQMKLTKNQVERKRKYLKLAISKQTKCLIAKSNRAKALPKKLADYKVNPEQFLNIQAPEIAYILGLLWSDGYIPDKLDFIQIESLEKDLTEVKDLFLKTGQWCISERTRPNRQKQMAIQTNNKIIANFLKNHDYHVKSNASADKILSKIPEHLQHYWWRGLSDGDGCFYINKINKIYQYSIASSYHQNWIYAEKLLNSLNIKYSIARRSQLQNGKINQSSIIRFCSKQNIYNFGSYIYQGYENDKIGFTRKYQKFLIVKDILFSGNQGSPELSSP